MPFNVVPETFHIKSEQAIGLRLAAVAPGGPKLPAMSKKLQINTHVYTIHKHEYRYFYRYLSSRVKITYLLTSRGGQDSVLVALENYLKNNNKHKNFR